MKVNIAKGSTSPTESHGTLHNLPEDESENELMFTTARHKHRHNEEAMLESEDTDAFVKRMLSDMLLEDDEGDDETSIFFHDPLELHSAFEAAELRCKEHLRAWVAIAGIINKKRKTHAKHFPADMGKKAREVKEEELLRVDDVVKRRKRPYYETVAVDDVQTEKEQTGKKQKRMHDDGGGGGGEQHVYADKTPSPTKPSRSVPALLSTIAGLKRLNTAYRFRNADLERINATCNSFLKDFNSVARKCQIKQDLGKKVDLQYGKQVFDILDVSRDLEDYIKKQNTQRQIGDFSHPDEEAEEEKRKEKEKGEMGPGGKTAAAAATAIETGKKKEKGPERSPKKKDTEKKKDKGKKRVDRP